MTHEAYPSDERRTDAPSPAERTLPPGNGTKLRRNYVKLLAITLPSVLIIMLFPLYTTFTSPSNPLIPTLLVTDVVLVASSACGIAALLRGRKAVQGDVIALPAMSSSGRIARFGGLVAWLGAPVIAVTGAIQHYQGVDLAFLFGIAFGLAAAVPAVCNDGAFRLAKRLVAG